MTFLRKYLTSILLESGLCGGIKISHCFIIISYKIIDSVVELLNKPMDGP